MSFYRSIALPSDVQDRRIAYTLLRLAVGLSLFGHGLVRLPKLTVFHAWMLDQFTTSIIPTGLVSPAGYVLPVVELLLGLSVTFGVLTRVGLIGGAALMITLIFGSTTIENWAAIGDQLLHAIPLTILLAFGTYNTYSVDNIMLRRFVSGVPAA